jgi:uncharacterized membrane protein
VSAATSEIAPARGEIPCPACGHRNAGDAVFCAECHKSLGPFRFVREELDALDSRYEKLAGRVARFVAQPHFFVTHLLWIGFWVAANTGIVMVARQFDEYPFNLLGIILSVEAILLTGFLLLSQQRQQEQADKFAELEYEVNVRAYRETREVRALLESALRRLESIEAALETRREKEATEQ